jgi:hypothetical protein
LPELEELVCCAVVGARIFGQEHIFEIHVELYHEAAEHSLMCEDEA